MSSTDCSSSNMRTSLYWLQQYSCKQTLTVIVSIVLNSTSAITSADGMAKNLGGHGDNPPEVPGCAGAYIPHYFINIIKNCHSIFYRLVLTAIMLQQCLSTVYEAEYCEKTVPDNASSTNCFVVIYLKKFKETWNLELV